MQVKLPTPATLRKYGLTESDYVSLWDEQGGCCPLCGRAFSDEVRPVIDHLHVRLWKRMPSDKRKKFVRGLLCIYDNRRMLPKGMTLEKAERVVAYLKRFKESPASPQPPATEGQS